MRHFGDTWIAHDFPKLLDLLGPFWTIWGDYPQLPCLSPLFRRKIPIISEFIIFCALVSYFLIKNFRGNFAILSGARERTRVPSSSRSSAISRSGSSGAYCIVCFICSFCVGASFFSSASCCMHTYFLCSFSPFGLLEVLSQSRHLFSKCSFCSAFLHSGLCLRWFSFPLIAM